MSFTNIVLTRNETFGSLTLPKMSSTSARTASPTLRAELRKDFLASENDRALLVKKEQAVRMLEQASRTRSSCVIEI